MPKVYVTDEIQAINALKRGEILTCEANGFVYNMIQDTIICRDGNGRVCVGAPIDISQGDIYYGEGEELCFEIGKFYKTKDNQKVLLGYKKGKSLVFINQEDGDTYETDDMGRDFGEGVSSGRDIIAEWEK